MVAGFDMSLQRLRWFATRTRTKPFGRLHALDAPPGDCRMWRRAGCADRAVGVCASSLPQPQYQDDRALSGRRHDRFPRPPGGRADQGRAWRHRHCRKQAGRRDHARRGAGRKSGGRWLHAVDGDLDHACHQQDAVQEIAVRPGEGFRADRAGGRGAVCADRQSGGPGKDVVGFHCLRQVEAWIGLRLGRQRQSAASRCRDA